MLAVQIPGKELLVLCEAALLVVFDDEEGGVGCDNAVPTGQLSGFIAQFLVIAVETNFIEQIADPPCGPETGDEFMVVGLRGKGGFVNNLAFLAVEQSFDFDDAFPR